MRLCTDSVKFLLEASGAYILWECYYFVTNCRPILRALLFRYSASNRDVAVCYKASKGSTSKNYLIAIWSACKNQIIKPLSWHRYLFLSGKKVIITHGCHLIMSYFCCANGIARTQLIHKSISFKCELFLCFQLFHVVILPIIYWRFVNSIVQCCFPGNLEVWWSYYCSLRDMDAIFKNTIFNIVLLIGIIRSYGNATRWIPLDLTDHKSTWVPVRSWCQQATSHYLTQQKGVKTTPK